MLANRLLKIIIFGALHLASFVESYKKYTVLVTTVSGIIKLLQVLKVILVIRFQCILSRALIVLVTQFPVSSTQA